MVEELGKRGWSVKWLADSVCVWVVVRGGKEEGPHGGGEGGCWVRKESGGESWEEG